MLFGVQALPAAKWGVLSVFQSSSPSRGGVLRSRRDLLNVAILMEHCGSDKDSVLSGGLE